MRSSVVILIVVVALVSAGTTRNRNHKRRNTEVDKCSSRCTGVSTHYAFETGKSYTYSFESRTEIKLDGSIRNKNAIDPKAQIKISVISPCEMSLQVLNYELPGIDGVDELTSQMQQYPMRFSFDDGLIRELCPDSRDSIQVVNLKRGILSTLQNSLEGHSMDISDTKNVMENDISGRCPTDYEISMNGNDKIIQRKKNLLSCRGHRGNRTSIRGTPYEITSDVQNAPLLDSDQECRHTVRDSILQEATCTEKHAFRPFRNGEKGLISITNQKLTLIKQGTDVTQAAIGPRQSLNFDHHEDESEASSEAKNAALGNLRQYCEISSETVSAETPGLFNELIYNLRKLSEQDLKRVVQHAKTSSSCSNEKTFMMDALPMCGSEACVKVAVDEILAGVESRNKEGKACLAAFALVHRPTKNMVKHVTPLVSKVDASGLLGISSLVRSYCRENPMCAEVQEVEQFMAELKKKIPNGCKLSNREDKKNIMFILKAVGNVGAVQSIVPSIKKCYTNEENSIEIRSTAIQALRRMPCSVLDGAVGDDLLEMIEDHSTNVEIRIAAFLGRIRCPNPELLNRISQQMKREKSNQVGTFMYTYLQTKKSTTDPCQQELADILADVQLSSKFNKDPRKFSRFTEVGSFSDKINLGGHAEMAYIFGETGYLPKQAFANLTLHLFGTRVNLFEIGGRIDGLEEIIDRLYGPDGYFSHPNSYYFNKHTKETKNGKIKALQDLFSSRMKGPEHLSLSVYTRMFGDDIAYKSLENWDVVEDIEKAMSFDTIVAKLAKLHEVNIAKNVQFLDTTITVPTISGMPLRLSVNGTASIDLQISAQADFRSLIRHQKMSIKTDIKPRAAVELSSMMTMQTGAVKSGVKLLTRLHTSTAQALNMQLKDGQLKSTFELPQTKQEIISVETQLISVIANRQIVEKGIVADRFEKLGCTSPGLNRLTGLKMCTEVAYPNASRTEAAPYFPLTGPVKFAITLEKDDPSLTSYEFIAAYKSIPAEKSFLLSFNTPGSQVDREVKAEIKLSNGRDIDVLLKCPAKELSISVAGVKQGNKNTVKVTVLVDKTREMQLDAKLEKRMLPNGVVRYEWESKAKEESSEPMVFDGQLEMQMPFNKFMVDAKMQGPQFESPWQFKVLLERSESERQMYNTEFKLVHPKVHADAKAMMKGDSTGSKEMEVTANCRLPKDGNKEHKMKWAHKATFNREGDTFKMEQTDSYETSSYPKWNWNVQTNFEKSSKAMELRLDGQAPYAKPFKAHAINRKEGGRDVTDVSVVCPFLNLDHNAKVELENKLPESFNSLVNINTPRMKDIVAKVDYKNKNTNGLWGMNAEAELKYPGRDIKLVKEFNEVNPKEYHSSTVIQWQKNNQLTLETDIKLKSTKGVYEYEIETEGQMTGYSSPFKIHKRFKTSPQETKYIVFASGDRVFYDLKMDMIKDNAEKSRFLGHLKSEMVKDMDYSVLGVFEKHRRTTKVTFTTQKKSKDVAKGEFIYPTRLYANTPEKNVKGQLVWNLDNSAPSELLVNWKTETPAENEKTHDLTMKVLIGDMGYKYNAKVRKNDYYTLNSTLTRNNNQIMAFNMGLKHAMVFDPRDMHIDFAVQTWHPMKKTHVVGLLSHKQSEYSFDTQGHLKCELSNKGANFRVFANAEDGDTNGKAVTYGIEGRVNEMSLKYNDRIENYEQLSLFNLKGADNLEIVWAPTKKITSSTKTDITDKRISFEWKLNTPFDTVNEMKTEVLCNYNGNKFDHKVVTEWNQNKRIETTLRGQVDSMMKGDVTGVLQTSFPALSKAEIKIKTDLESENNKIDKIELLWNDNNKLSAGFDYKKTGADGLLSTSFVARVGQMDWSGQCQHKVNFNTYKYETENTLKMNEDNYMIKVLADPESEDGQIEFSSPFESMRDAKIEISKTGENEYKFDLIRNGENAMSASGTLKLNKDGDQQVTIDVQNIQTPFKLSYDFKYRPEIFQIKTNVQVSQKSYGIELSDKDGRQTLIRVIHPKRTMHAKMLRQYDDRTWKLVGELQPNEAKNRQATKVELKYMKLSEGHVVFEGKVHDPSLPKESQIRVELESRMTAAEILFKQETKLTYSDDPDKTLKLSTLFKTNTAQTRARRSLEAKNFEMEFFIEYPVTNLHYKAKAQGLISDQSCKMEAAVEYKTAQGELSKHSVLMQARQFNDVEITMRCGSNERGLKVSKHGDNGIKLMVIMNAQPRYSLTATCEEQGILFEAKKEATSEILFHMSAKMVTENDAVVKVWHSEGGKKVNDAEFGLKLAKSDLLRTKYYIRPQTYKNIKNMINKQMESMPVPNEYNLYGDAMRGVASSLLQADQHISQQLAPLGTYWSQEMEEFSADLGPVGMEIRNALTAYYSMMKEVVLSVIDVLEKTVDDIVKSLPSETVQQAYFDTKQAMLDIPQYFGEMSEPLARWFEFASNSLTKLSEQVQEVSQSVQESMNWKQVQDYLQDTWQSVKESTIWQTLSDTWERISSGRDIASLKQYADRGLDSSLVIMKDSVEETARDVVNKMLEYKAGQVAYEFAVELFNKIRWSYSYVDPEKQIDDMFKSLRETFSDMSTEALLQGYMPKITKKSPEKGLFEAEIPLPIKARSLKTILDSVHPDELNRVAMRFKNHLDQLSFPAGDYGTEDDSQDSVSGYSLWDPVYQFKPKSWQPKHWAPPFRSTAYLIGNQHIVTFDGQVYDFAADCDYLLARDFKDGKFTITSSFDRQGPLVSLTSITLNTRGQDIEIGRDGSLKVDGEEKQLPWMDYDTIDGRSLIQVIRKTYKVALKTADGIEIRCYDYFGVCTVGLPGRYQGRTAGLLGTFDNEGHNDMLLPDGSIAENIDTLAQKYHVGTTCTSHRNVAKTGKLPKEHEMSDQCENYFKSSTSSFRACFMQVSPKAYYSMCETDMHHAVNTFTADRFMEGICNVSAAYIKACKSAGVPLEIPDQCVPCTTMPSTTESLEQGENVRLEESQLPQNQADIVFVVEEKPCMEWTKGRLANLGQEMAQLLKSEKHINDVQFGVVAFGGEGVHRKPHFHTASNGQIRYTKTGLQMAVSDLYFERTAMVERGHIEDPMKAMNFVAQRFPFRAGVQKNVILFSCSRCGEKFDYYDLQHELLQQDITFHMLSSKAIQLEDGGTAIGFDAKSVFMQQGEPRTDLRSKVTEPHDSCTSLAQETNGTVFSGAANVQQKAVTHLAVMVAIKAQPPSCQICECQLQKFKPITVCYPCQVPRPVSLTSGGGSFFNIPYLKLSKNEITNMF